MALMHLVALPAVLASLGYVAMPHCFKPEIILLYDARTARPGYRPPRSAR